MNMITKNAGGLNVMDATIGITRRVADVNVMRVAGSGRLCRGPPRILVSGHHMHC